MINSILKGNELISHIKSDREKSKVFGIWWLGKAGFLIQMAGRISY